MELLTTGIRHWIRPWATRLLHWRAAWIVVIAALGLWAASLVHSVAKLGQVVLSLNARGAAIDVSPRFFSFVPIRINEYLWKQRIGISISGIRLVPPSSTADELRILTPARGLTVLHVGETCFDDEMLRRLRCQASLETLFLDGTRVTGTGLDRIGEFTKLTTLSVDRTGIDGTMLSRLETCKRLESLSLSRTGIDDSDLASLSRLPALADLDLSFTKVSCSGVGQLRKLSRLQSLSLQGTSIDDRCVEQLRQLRSLSHLDLRETSISHAACIRLQEWMPGTFIIEEE